MKKHKVLLFLTAALFAVLGLSLTSCMSDQYEPVPVKMSDINGNYKARLITSQGGMFNEKIIDFTAKDSIVIFKDFPVKEIVKAVIADPIKADTALAHLGKIEYKLHYTSKINTGQNVIELTFEPKTLALQIPVDGTVRNTVVKLISKQKGFFIGYDGSMRFGLEAEKITVNGTDLPSYQTIKYEVPISVKY